MKNRRLHTDDYGTTMRAETNLLQVNFNKVKHYDNDNMTEYRVGLIQVGTNEDGTPQKYWANIPVNVLEVLGISSNEQLPIEVTVSGRRGDNGPLYNVLSSDVATVSNADAFGDLLDKVDKAAPRKGSNGSTNVVVDDVEIDEEVEIVDAES